MKIQVFRSFAYIVTTWNYQMIEKLTSHACLPPWVSLTLIGRFYQLLGHFLIKFLSTITPLPSPICLWAPCKKYLTDDCNIKEPMSEVIASFFSFIFLQMANHNKLFQSTYIYFTNFFFLFFGSANPSLLFFNLNPFLLIPSLFHLRYSSFNPCSSTLFLIFFFYIYNFYFHPLV